MPTRRPEPKGPFLLSAAVRPRPPSTAGYPLGLPAVRALEKVKFQGVTVFVGDNGTGKSTIVEALAVAAGFNAEGGSRNLDFRTHSTHSSLHEHLELRWATRPRWGWFLRAETFYGMATHIATDDPQYGVRSMFPDLHAESHGESFIDLALERFSGPGLYIFDEPEAALSLQGQWKLLRIMHDGLRAGAQFVMATHSPALMAFPGAALYEFDDDGIHPAAYDDLEVVGLWRRFLRDPSSILRHLLDDEE